MLLSISVIVPCFNSEKWISLALESLLRQNVPKLEIIVVNDGSNDSTKEIVESYGDRVVLINQANSGVSSARREGVRQATGDYIKFLDSDDLLPDGALRNMLEVAEKYPCEAIIAKAVAIGADERSLDKSKYSLAHCPSHLELMKKEFLLTQATPSGLWLLPRNVIDYDHFFKRDIRLGEEYGFCIEIIRSGIPIRFCDRVVYIVRDHNSPTRLSSTKNEADHLKQIDLISNSIRFIKYEIDGYRQESLDFIAQLCWSRGRDCLRIGCEDAANAYFTLAKKIQPSLDPVGSIAYRTVCRIVGPVKAEKLVSRIKHVIHAFVSQ